MKQAGRVFWQAIKDWYEELLLLAGLAAVWWVLTLLVVTAPPAAAGLPLEASIHFCIPLRSSASIRGSPSSPVHLCIHLRSSVVPFPPESGRRGPAITQKWGYPSGLSG